MADLESPDAFARRVCQPLSYDHDAMVAEIAERDRRVRAEAMRVCALYSDALSVIAHHPGGDEVPEWMKSKAREALAKTQAAERGEIYGADAEALRAQLAKTEAVVAAARSVPVPGLGNQPLYAALRALDSPVGVAATACDHKRQRCENDHAVCVDCGAVNRAVTGVVDWGPPETAREEGSTGAVACKTCPQRPGPGNAEACGATRGFPFQAGDDCGCRCHADPPPDYLTRAELVAAVRSAAAHVGGPPSRALDALADALEKP